MNYLLPFFLGFVITFITTLLPGLINMTVAKISLKEGQSRAFALGSGASFIVFFQALVATIFSRFIDKRTRSEEHTSELQSRPHLVCRLLLEKKKNKKIKKNHITNNNHQH